MSGTATAVYNLEVEGINEFYANGVLVHNCPICAPLGGLVFGEDGAQPAAIGDQEQRGVQAALGEAFVHPGGKDKAGNFEGQAFEMPPAHTRCRCWISPEV